MDEHDDNNRLRQDSESASGKPQQTAETPLRTLERNGNNSEKTIRTHNGQKPSTFNALAQEQCPDSHQQNPPFPGEVRITSNAANQGSLPQRKLNSTHREDAQAQGQLRSLTCRAITPAPTSIAVRQPPIEGARQVERLTRHRDIIVANLYLRAFGHPLPLRVQPRVHRRLRARRTYRLDLA